MRRLNRYYLDPIRCNGRTEDCLCRITYRQYDAIIIGVIMAVVIVIVSLLLVRRREAAAPARVCQPTPAYQPPPAVTVAVPPRMKCCIHCGTKMPKEAVLSELLRETDVIDLGAQDRVCSVRSGTQNRSRTFIRRGKAFSHSRSVNQQSYSTDSVGRRPLYPSI